MAANAPSLVISQLKITSSSGQFITLYNSTGLTLDMSKYQLEYFNNYDLSKATSSRLISLTGTVPPHGYFMVNDGVYTLCYQLSVDSVSLGLSSTAGLVEVVAFDQSSPGGSVSPVLQDYVGWSKTAASGAQTLPANTAALLLRQPVDIDNNPSITSPGVGSWLAVQPGNNACNLINSSNSSLVATGFGQLLPSSEPAATVISADSSSAAASPTATLPAADIGLMAPSITEILPNPAGSGNDATDEFIELYNPNSSSFDMTGFSLQAGTTTLHSYNFMPGTILPAQSFTAFYSSMTGLSLSNNSGQVKLLDPFGNSISVTAPYSTAKDGLAWALANGKWYWTTHLTAGSANIIDQPSTTKKTGGSTTSKSKSKSKTTAKTTKTPKTKTTASYSNTAQDSPSTTPIHTLTLALVASLALLYGAYEYRADLANYIHRLRWHRRASQADRPTPERRRSD